MVALFPFCLTENGTPQALRDGSFSGLEEASWKALGRLKNCTGVWVDISGYRSEISTQTPVQFLSRPRAFLRSSAPLLRLL